MRLPDGLPVVDHHCHLSPHGEGVAAARRFRAAGGTHLFLATQNYEGKPPVSLEGYRAQFATTEALARQVREATGVVVYTVLAPYPIDLLAAAENLGVAGAEELHRGALELAAAEVREGRAVALGEVGRPHFPVPAELAAAIDRSFRYALEVARDVGCPVVVHSADLDREGLVALRAEAARAGLPPEHVVKHYAREFFPRVAEVGAVPSYLAKRELVREAWSDPGPWFLETDFLDDPRRPGAVLDLATVPRRAASFAAAHPEATDRLWTPFAVSVDRVYGFTPSVGPGGPA